MKFVMIVVSFLLFSLSVFSHEPACENIFYAAEIWASNIDFNSLSQETQQAIIRVARGARDLAQIDSYLDLVIRSRNSKWQNLVTEWQMLFQEPQDELEENLLAKIKFAAYSLEHPEHNFKVFDTPVFLIGNNNRKREIKKQVTRFTQSGLIGFTRHAKYKMNKREIENEEVLQILTSGNFYVSDRVRFVNEHGNAVFTLEALDKDGDDLRIIVTLVHQVSVITVYRFDPGRSIHYSYKKARRYDIPDWLPRGSIWSNQQSN